MTWIKLGGARSGVLGSARSATASAALALRDHPPLGREEEVQVADDSDSNPSHGGTCRRAPPLSRARDPTAPAVSLPVSAGSTTSGLE